MKLSVSIKDYPRPGEGNAGRRGLAWRRAVHKAIVDEANNRQINYFTQDELQVEVLLYMDEGQLRFHDVDNLTKHLLDALQGRLGGAGKSKQANDRVVPNDAQIQRLVVEKRRRITQKQRSKLVVTGYVHS